jgi:L-alanine-DL-glutamate epimerase-like enolase superfamily enzyme
MIIRQIEIYKSPLKLKDPFVISLGTVYSANNIIVIIRSDNGLSGAGECSPFMTINGESIDTCFIVGQYLAGSLLGKNPLNIEECSSLMNKTIYGNSSIKSAFDIALYDIASQEAGLPLCSFLGGKKNKQLITDYTVSLGSPEKMASDAIKTIHNGFPVVKVKLGSSGREDIKRIHAIRKAIGNEIPLRIDANQGWNIAEATETLKALDNYNIQFCEEPIARWDYMNLPALKKMSPIPIMADESCCDHHDAERLINLDACDFFNIKLGKSSGIFNAIKITRLAEKAGFRLQTGGFMESRLGFTAAAHFAMTSDNIVFCDFDTPLMQEEDPVIDGILYGRGGIITLPQKPGLGASVDPEYLERLEKKIIR